MKHLKSILVLVVLLALLGASQPVLFAPMKCPQPRMLDRQMWRMQVQA
jgi:hypothetical protein